ncbi:MAG: DNA-protecting protein DprA [Chlorobi bacterium]|nr:DNA-protecting protein DprA [Chlorobiota bacterium]
MLNGNQELELTHRIALRYVEGIGNQLARKIIASQINLKDIFEGNAKEVSKLLGIEGIGRSTLVSFERSARQAIEKALQVLDQCQKHDIELAFFDESTYPPLLKHCDDAPYVLCYKGSIDWFNSPSVAIVGTRRPTPYGISVTKELLEGLASVEPVIVSGLAYGIDSVAHEEALNKGLYTVAVLAHGLDIIYPAAHKRLATKIIESGGALISEFFPGEKPEKEHFPRRNRVIAGVSEATVVIESKEDGGAIITAHFAFDYGREVFAVPGRVHDKTSRGCLKLIKDNIASVVIDAQTIIDSMGWTRRKQLKQKTLFLTPEEQAIYDLLRASNNPLSIEEISSALEKPIPEVMNTLLMMEMKGLVKSMPGQRFSL